MHDGTREIWRPIPGWEGYYDASTYARIRGLDRFDNWGRRVRGTILAQTTGPTGYRQVGLSRDGVTTTYYVHYLIAITFVGPQPPNEEVLHKDDNPGNNLPSNLKWGPHSENQHLMALHGHSNAGERHPFTTLTNADAAAIRAAWQQGISGVELAGRYGISTPAVSRIVNGATFRGGEVLTRPRGTCHFPGCENLVEEGVNGRGRPLVFCEDPDHGNATAKAERQRLECASRERPTVNCLYCGEPFIQTRTDKVYCSRQHAALARYYDNR